MALSFRRGKAILLCAAAASLCAEPRAIPLNAVPMAFEPNRGQAGSEVRFISRAGSNTVLLSQLEALMLVATPAPPRIGGARPPVRQLQAVPIRMQFPGASRYSTVEGQE